MKKIKFYNAVLELSKTKHISTISVRDIANHLGISTGALYYQFKSKDDLLNEMFVYYKLEYDEFIEELDTDPTTFLQAYLDYYSRYIDQFKFTYSSELAHILNHTSLVTSLSSHLKTLDKIGLDYEKDAHLVTIIFGTIRAYLLAPDYMKKCDQKLMIEELVKLFK